MVAYIHAKHIHLLGCSCRLRKRLWPAEIAFTSSIPPKLSIEVVFETRRRQWSTTIWPWIKTRSCARWVREQSLSVWHTFGTDSIWPLESLKITVPHGQAYNNIADPWLKMASRERNGWIFHQCQSPWRLLSLTTCRQVIYHDQATRAERKGALDKSTVLYDSCLSSQQTWIRDPVAVPLYLPFRDFSSGFCSVP